tara:strand:+ start:134 stop:346 length:213 start_codon:yes stop_codon:yes gene_type:complete
MSEENSKINIDGVEYDKDSLSDVAKSQIYNIEFVDQSIQRLENELAVSDTARIGYLKALKSEYKNKTDNE